MSWGFDVFVSVSVLSASLPGLVGNVSSSQYLIIAVTQQFCFLLIGLKKQKKVHWPDIYNALLLSYLTNDKVVCFSFAVPQDTSIATQTLIVAGSGEHCLSVSYRKTVEM